MCPLFPYSLLLTVGACYAVEDARPRLLGVSLADRSPGLRGFPPAEVHPLLSPNHGCVSSTSCREAYSFSTLLLVSLQANSSRKSFWELAPLLDGSFCEGTGLTGNQEENRSWFGPASFERHRVPNVRFHVLLGGRVILSPQSPE